MPSDRIKLICDSAQRLFVGDDAFYAGNLVNSTMTQIFELEYPELGWLNGGLLAMRQEVDPGAYSYDHLMMGSVGLAEIVSDRATDIPEVDIEGTRTPRSIVTVGCSFSFSTQDLRQSTMMGRQGVNLDIASRKAVTARKAHDRRINQLLALGNGPAGLFGITNHPGITVLPAITGAWQTATAAQIAADFEAAYLLMDAQTQGVEIPDSAVVSSTILARLRGLTWDAGNSSNISTLQYLETAWGVKFYAENTMRTASAAGGNALLLYNKSADKAFGVMPLILEASPVTQVGYVFKVAMESRFGGVSSPYPLSILRLDGI